MELDAYSIAGVIGSVIIIAAFFVNQEGWLSAKDWRYSCANLLGASLILVSLYSAWNLGAAIIEGFWMIISLYGLSKNMTRQDAD